MTSTQPITNCSNFTREDLSVPPLKGIMIINVMLYLNALALGLQNHRVQASPQCG